MCLGVHSFDEVVALLALEGLPLFILDDLGFIYLCSQKLNWPTLCSYRQRNFLLCEDG
ncbi:hypothetical protein SLEP1_g30868 [Rubroshorea leprosula]|uniref:Uncharacterized protein n=1 Tax=Rubroshorea leprosula TaxID=152421 RepID=A0AAV5K3Z3_9ROSI|nr:hypothetical protein SLEP1_g30868 [Rubroshorea leprosula]